MIAIRKHWLGLVWLLAAWPLLAEQLAVPQLDRPLLDLTGTLSSAQTAQLDEKLRAFARSKGSQVAVLIVASTQPEAIEQYSMRVVEQWQLGRASVDDGVLLLVAKQDRAMRIEVGYGLEGVIPDAYAKRIIDETIAPRFQQSDFFGGIDAGVTQLMALISGEQLPPPTRQVKRGESLMIWLAVSVFSLSVLPRFLAALIGAGLAAFLAWMIWATITATLIAAIVAWFVVLIWPQPSFAGYGDRDRDRWSDRPNGGFGGGFSGGGGRFGGGGASGGW